MTQREEFEAWWEEFSSAHEDWHFADGDALRWATWQAAKRAQPEPYGYHSPKTGKVYASTEAASMAMAGEVKTVYLAQPERAPLTESEISKLVMPYGFSSIQGFDHIKAYTRRVEAYIKQGGQHG